MSTSISSLTQQHQNQLQPPPQMQPPQMQQMQPNQPQQQQQHYAKPLETNMDSTQKELLFLFVIISIATSEPIQRQLMSLAPSLFNDLKPSIIANAVNAGVICMVFYFTRNMKIQIGE